MPYILKPICITNQNKKAYEILLDLNYSIHQAQKIIDKKRLYCDNKLINFKNEIVNGEISIITYNPMPKGLRPIFECEEFAVFDKPSGVLSHPNGRNCIYSMNDEIYHLFGENAGVAHRLDKETSGILVVGKSKNALKILKKSFENREISKTYHALVSGKIDKDSIINLPIAKSINSDIKIKMEISDKGKEAITYLKVIKFYENLNATLVELSPKTGRQHQLRIHMFHMKHKILGDPMYGINTDIVEAIMDNKLSPKERIYHTGASRLCLHNSEICFNFLGKNFKIKTKIDYEKSFLQASKTTE